MKMNNFSLIGRILIRMTIVCLTVTSLGIQPAQASPPAIQDYKTEVSWDKAVEKTICPGKHKAVASFTVKPVPGGNDYPDFFKNASAMIEAKKVTILSGKKMAWPEVRFGQKQKIDIEFTAKEEGKASLDVYVLVGMRPGEPSPLHAEFEVKKTCAWNIHGTADMGAVVNAMLPIKVWDFVGTYDIAGKIKANEDGTLNGQGTANLFTDAFFIGGAGMEGITCSHLSPWQGNTTIEIEADPNAWANEDILELSLAPQPMRINTTRIVCQGDEGYGWGDSPALSVASFDLNFDALPADGGSTSLKFSFPGGKGELEMNLIVTQEEAES